MPIEAARTPRYAGRRRRNGIAMGLAVAVPAVLGYNWLIRRNKVAMDQVRGFGADLHAVLLSAPKAAAPASARG